MFKVFLLYILILLLLPAPGSCGYIGRMKAEHADGETVSVCGVVTASCNTGCDPWTYIEDEDGSAGILVYGFAGGERAACATPEGVIFTDVTGERAVMLPPGSMVPHTTPQRTPSPVLMPNRCVGGGDFRYDPVTGNGQKGIVGCCGLNNIGLLVKTTGKVKWVSGNMFGINDGSGMGASGLGLMVYCGFMPTQDQTDMPWVGDYVSVVGISTCTSPSQPVITPMHRYDIINLSVWPLADNPLPFHRRADPGVVAAAAPEAIGFGVEAAGTDRFGY